MNKASTVALKRHLKILILSFENNQYNPRFDGCASVDSTLVQSSIRRLSNRRFDAYTIVDSTVTQPSMRHLQNRQI